MNAVLIWIIYSNKRQVQWYFSFGKPKMCINFWDRTSRFCCHIFRCVSSHTQWWSDLFSPQLALHYCSSSTCLWEINWILNKHSRRISTTPKSQKILSAAAFIRINTVTLPTLRTFLSPLNSHCAWPAAKGKDCSSCPNWEHHKNMSRIRVGKWDLEN